MAFHAQTLRMSVEENLSESFRPDVDYVDGYIEERNVGEMDHGTVRGVLYALFLAKRKDWGIRPTLITLLKFPPPLRVPDVALVRPEHRQKQIIRTARLSRVEVLSPEDTMPRRLAKIREYLAMVVPEVWIIASLERSLTVCLADGSKLSHRTRLVNLAGSAVSVDVGDPFSIPDEK